MRSFELARRALSWWEDRRTGKREASWATEKARLFSIQYSAATAEESKEVY